MSAPKPFKCHVPDERLQKLKARLELTELPDEISDGVQPWERGVPLSEVRRLHEYWKSGFDWRISEVALNSFPQFTLEVEVSGFGPQQIHFMHLKSRNRHAIPLLFVHGWPGSFIEATKIGPQLVETSDTFPSFHVVAPSLPSFGFSGPVKKAGFHSAKHAETLHKLMLALGYTQYVTQGGDVGSSVTRSMALQYPESCRAHHLNMLYATEPTADKFPKLVEKIKTTQMSEQETSGLQLTKQFFASGLAYALLHMTRPQTIGYSMIDSPVGLLAWMYEKLKAWTDNYPWTDDEILTWVSIYYFSTAGPHAPARWYCETIQSNEQAEITQYLDVKLGISRFPKEIVQTPYLWAEALGPVVFEKVHDRGGHFAAWEVPEALVADLREMFGRTGGASQAVDGCSGFAS